MTREEAIEVIKANYPCGGYHDLCDALDMAIKALEQEPKTGRWLDWTDDRKDYLKCSICGYGEEGEVEFGEYTPYCPMCGARMIEP